MKKIIITGGNSFLSFHLVRYLEKDFKIICLFRKKVKNKFSKNIKKYILDKTKLEEIFKKEKNIFAVIHNAAFHSGANKNYEKFYNSNVALTKKILEISKNSNVKNFLYLSSARTIGKKRGISDNRTPYNLKKIDNYYGYTKYLGEKVCLNFKSKMNIKLVNPSMIIGKNDFNPSPCGQLIRKILTKNFSFVIDTTVNLVDINDVCRAIKAIILRGKNKTKYILNAETISLIEFFKRISFGKKMFFIYLPYFVLVPVFKIMPLFLNFVGKNNYSVNTIYLAQKKFRYDGSFITKDLNFKYRNIKKSIKAAAIWHKNYLSRLK